MDIRRLETEFLMDEAEIVRAHAMILQDPGFHGRVFERLRQTRCSADEAVRQVMGTLSAILEASEDPVLAARAADFRDLALRLSSKLASRRQSDLDLALGRTPGAIIALPELLPSVVLEARASGAAGFIVESGTGVSHGAILARSFGLPVVRVGNLELIKPFTGQPVLVSGEGKVLVAPTASERKAPQPPIDAGLVERAVGAADARVWISIVDPQQLEGLDWSRIAGVGLYRSEALFLRHREDFPGEDAQFEAYRRLFELAGNRPVVVRTADLGADKPVEHMRFGPQENPALGLRAHRLYRFHPELLITQVRAILRAAHGDYQLRLMFPMLECIEQLRFVRRLVDQAKRSLSDEGTAFQRNFHLGLLVETPSAVWGFERLLKEIDFASIGTNDLVQYLFAVDRNTANVAHLHQPEHPITLDVIHQLAQQAADAGKSLSICGEMASDIALLPALIGLGLRDFTVAPGAVAAVSRCLMTAQEDACQELADRCRAADTLAEVHALLDWLPHADTDLLGFGAGEAVDPVCGMVVRIDQAAYVKQAGPVTHFFCSKSCLNQFINGHHMQGDVQGQDTGVETCEGPRPAHGVHRS